MHCLPPSGTIYKSHTTIKLTKYESEQFGIIK